MHSVSYGDVEASIDDSYRVRLNVELQKFGVSGRTVLVAAGDSGVSCHLGQFWPDWPTSSPYVTSVGGTDGPVRAWSGGGGGFSNHYPMPAYQEAAVNKYLNSPVAPASHYFNASGRAYPDVAAFATNFEIVVGGGTTGVAGTSCATPTFAGVISILNDVRLLAGKPTLGFVNPLLYKIGAETPKVSARRRDAVMFPRPPPATACVWSGGCPSCLCLLPAAGRSRPSPGLAKLAP